MDEITNNPSLLNKKADDLTVGDNFKLIAIVTTAFVGIPVAIAGVSAGVQKVHQLWKQKKEARKNDFIETTAVEEETV